MSEPTYSEIAEDPCTPYWVQDLIPVLLAKDPVDVLNALDVLAAAAAEHLRLQAGGGRFACQACGRDHLNGLEPCAVGGAR